MRKTRLAVACATLSLMPLTAAADTALRDEIIHRIDVMPQLYGNIHLAIEHTHTNDGVTGGKMEYRDAGSYLGVRHQHEVYPGLRGFLRAEFEFDSDDGEDRGLDRLEYAYIGVEGDFGRIWGGTDDTIYEQQIDHIANFFMSGDLASGDFSSRNKPGVFDTGRTNLIQYQSPRHNRWQFFGAIQLNEDGDDRQLEEEGKTSRPWQLAATYTVRKWEWAFGVDSNDGGSGPDNTNTYGVRGTYDSPRWGVILQAQRRDDIQDLYGVLARYTIDRNQFAVAWEYEKDKITRQTSKVYSVQFLHEMSESLNLYVEGFQVEADRGGPDRRDLSVGVSYKF